MWTEYCANDCKQCANKVKTEEEKQIGKNIQNVTIIILFPSQKHFRLYSRSQHFFFISSDVFKNCTIKSIKAQQNETRWRRIHRHNEILFRASQLYIFFFVKHSSIASTVSNVDILLQMHIVIKVHKTIKNWHEKNLSKSGSCLFQKWGLSECFRAFR